MSHLNELRQAGGDRDVLVQAAGLSRGVDLPVGLQHQLLLQVDPQHVAVLPLLVRQIGQHHACSLATPATTASTLRKNAGVRFT